MEAWELVTTEKYVIKLNVMVNDCRKRGYKIKRANRFCECETIWQFDWRFAGCACW